MGFPTAIARRIGPSIGGCTHAMTQFVIDGDADLVRCDRCKAVVSPMLALKRLVRAWDSQAAAVQALAEKRDQLELEVEALRKERATLRAGVKRSKERAEVAGG